MDGRIKKSGQMTENAEAQDQENEEKKSGGIITLVLWLFVVVGSIGSGFATPFLIDKFSGDPEEASPEAAADSEEPPAIIEFGEVVVNLNESDMRRYLRADISLVVAQSEQQQIDEQLKKNQAILKSWLLSYLADKRMDDIRGTTGQNRLRREIQLHFNSVLFPDGVQRIRNVLFVDFNIQ